MPAFQPDDPSRRDFLATVGVLTSGIGLLAASSVQAQENVPLAPPDKQPTDLVLPQPARRKIGWAVVGLGTLSVNEILPAFGQSRRSRLVALGSGHPDKAAQLASVYDVNPKHVYSYQDYDQIANNPEIDAVYIVLPNSMHAEFTIRALKAGKHVLCEKPMATSVAECEQMIAAADAAKRKLMIAYRLRYEPFNQKVIELCESGSLSKIKLISASHSQNVKAPNIRLSSQLGGGPLGDVGIYCLNAARYITRQEPVEVVAFNHQPKNDPRFREVPESVSFTLRFADGVEAHCGCSFGTGENRFYKIECAEGVIELDQAFGYRGQVLRVSDKDGSRRLKIDPVNHFAAEMDHFSQCIAEDKTPRTPGAEGLADHRAMAAIEEAARTGRAVRVAEPK